MRISQWLNNNPALVTLSAIVVLAVSLVIVFMQFREPAPPRYEAYYWDLGSGEIFTADRSQLPPIATDAGGQGVRAHLFTCGSCSADQWFGYLETYSDEYHRALNETGFKGMSPKQIEQFKTDHHLIRAIDDSEWVPRESPQGRAIRKEIQSRCGQPEQLIECGPATATTP